MSASNSTSTILLSFAAGAAIALLGAAWLRTPPAAGDQPPPSDSQHVHAALPATTDETPFLRENAAAMDRMMKGMDVTPSGDIDRDFVEMMVPHHQGAIDMSQAVLKYGKNERIRRLAQEIVVTQQEEIAAMRLAIGQPLPPSAAAPTNPK